MRISDWSSDVCSSDLRAPARSPALPADGQSGIVRRALFRSHRRSRHRRKGAAAMGALRIAVAAASLVLAAPANAESVTDWHPYVAEASARFGVPTAWIERVMREIGRAHV